MKAFSIFDKGVGAFMQPFYARAVGEALRMFTTAVNDEKADFGKYAADYELFEIADWNDKIGSFVPASGGARRVITALEVLRGAGDVS